MVTAIRPVPVENQEKEKTAIHQMNKKTFSIITKGKLTIPVIAHVPHGSTFIPKDVRQTLVLSDTNLKKELILMTDCYTSELFASIIEHLDEKFSGATRTLNDRSLGNTVGCNSKSIFDAREAFNITL
ncbi:MAG: hypothetical protein MUO26_13545 [Methanotrichaceae archaeon]|nr:hypothetical protein [Methanotrichaceae archaeon]